MTCFTRKWFYRRGAVSNFRQHFLPLAGQKLTYLEIGVFQGASLHWMLSNVLTHPESRAIGIDPWENTHRRSQDCMDAVFETAKNNLRNWTKFGKLLLVRSRSEQVLTVSENPILDIAYIDGHHGHQSVVADWKSLWPNLKPSGVLVFDDHTPGRTRNDGVVYGVQEFVRFHPLAKELFRSKNQIAFTKP